MAARILNGNAIRDQIYGDLASEIASLAAAEIRPGLAAVLIGDHPASRLYVNSKIAACGNLGLSSFLLTPSASITTEDLLSRIDELNRRDDVDGAAQACRVAQGNVDVVDAAGHPDDRLQAFFLR